ncbi:phosphotransferase [Paenibacillus mesotrionivorans]|uniref:Phosphotransferase n=1 Tax=Paenibacillus mesotrionivorans TaxID=3160968 RepID=A0ACC7NWL7_9BACL
MENLIKHMNKTYALDIGQMELHRELIGQVYILQSGQQQYVLKLLPPHKTADALHALNILDFLFQQEYPVVSVVRTREQMSHTLLPGDGRVAALFHYVEGADADGSLEAEAIGEQTARLHKLMERYPGTLLLRTKAEYIDDFISIMKQKDCEASAINDLVHYGNELWSRITLLPKSFCHGDLHTGNMIKQDGNYILLDFDDASGDYPSMDAAYLSDVTHFNQFHASLYDATMRQFERFYKGYSRVRILSDGECSAVSDWIAVRHYQITARIVGCQGLGSVSLRFFEEQHRWLMEWRELCVRRN